MPKISYAGRFEEKNYARFVASVSEMFSRYLINPNPKRPCPLPRKDLNFLDPKNNLFHMDHALYSAGQAAKSKTQAARQDMVTGRNRKDKTIILGDSGGYQIQTEAIKFKGDETRDIMLNWLQDNCTWSMVLDFPTNGILVGSIDPHIERMTAPYDKNIPDSGNKDKIEQMCLDNGKEIGFNVCLLQTLINNDYFQKHRTKGKTNFLNVVQGRNLSESKIWYDSVKHYDFEGWALAGQHKENFEMTMSRFIDMRDDGLLTNKNWCHFLGVGKYEPGPIYTTMQRSIQETINPNFTISYDASSPFTTAAYGNLFMGYTLDKRGWTIQSSKLDGREYLPGGEKAELMFLDELRKCWDRKIKEYDKEIHSEDLWFNGESDSSIIGNSRFVETEVGKLLQMQDICVNVDEKFTATWDVVAYALLMHHNVQVHIEGVFESQNLYEANDKNRVPHNLLELKDLIPEIFRSEKPRDMITKHAKLLNSLAGEVAENGVAVTVDFDMGANRIYNEKLELMKKSISIKPKELDLMTDLFQLPEK